MEGSVLILSYDILFVYHAYPYSCYSIMCTDTPLALN